MTRADATTRPQNDKSDRIKGAFFGALVSDALCLGSHYEYDAKAIKEAYNGIISEYMAPGEMMGGSTHGVGWGRRNYHPGQKKGDQTDYGEYNVLVLEYLASRKDTASDIDLNEFIPVWKKRVTENWGCWLCTMSRQTLQQVRGGARHDQLGGFSNAMAVRSAALFAVFESENRIKKAARTVSFTHRNTEALDGAEFFCSCCFCCDTGGIDPRQAIEEVSAKMSPWIQTQVKKGIEKYEEATDPTSALSKEEYVDDLAMTSMARLWDVGKTEPIKVGKASPTEGTLPSSVYIILKYMDSFIDAVKANAMVGGDNASRGVAIGMVLGAYHGVRGIPETFLSSLNAYEKCDKMLEKLPLLHAGTDHIRKDDL